MIPLFIAVFSASFPPVIVQFTVMPSLSIAFFRLFFAAVILFPLVLARHRAELRALPKKSLFFSALGGCLFGAHFVTYFESLQHTTVASTSIIVGTETFFVTFILFFYFRQPVSRRMLLGICVAFIGSVLIALCDNSVGSNLLYGDFLALISAILFALYSMVTLRYRMEISVTLFTFIAYSAASLFLLASCLGSGTALVGYRPLDYLLMLILTVFCTFLTHSIYAWVVGYLNAAFVASVRLLGPIFATIWAFWFFDQRPQPLALMGGLIVLVGTRINIAAQNQTNRASEEKPPETAVSSAPPSSDGR